MEAGRHREYASGKRGHDPQHVTVMRRIYPAGSRLALTLQGKDFERPGSTGPFRGSGPFLHNDPGDRDPATFGGTNTISTG